MVNSTSYAQERIAKLLEGKFKVETTNFKFNNFNPSFYFKINFLKGKLVRQAEFERFYFHFKSNRPVCS